MLKIILSGESTKMVPSTSLADLSGNSERSAY